MLRLVRPGETAPHNDLLREALDRVTLGQSGQEGYFIFLEHEAEALYHVLASRHFTSDQLGVWIDRLRADHPYDRRLTGRRVGFWCWVRWVILGGKKPQAFTVESVDDWRKRAGRYVVEQIASVDEPMWLERPLHALDNARSQIERETSKTQWAMPVMRWALVQLLTTSADTNSAHATG